MTTFRAVRTRPLPLPPFRHPQVTTSNLVFDPPSIAFGPCVLNEDTAVPLRITNPSALPQTFGFIDTTPGISIKPNDGFGYILPGEFHELGENRLQGAASGACGIKTVVLDRQACP